MLLNMEILSFYMFFSKYLEGRNVNENIFKKLLIEFLYSKRLGAERFKTSTLDTE